MRFYLNKPTKRGIVVRPSGGGTAGEGFIADHALLLIERGHGFVGVAWEDLVVAAEAPGYIDAPVPPVPPLANQSS